MVKNTKGGSGHKGQARKHVVTNFAMKTRLSENEYEQYAYVVKQLGGSNCQVVCQNGETRLCIIRGKFRGGRGKRDSFITKDSWLLVGIRDWESTVKKDGVMPKCDLLEVYTEADKSKLKTVPGVDWGMFVRNDISNSSSPVVDDDIVFSNATGENEYERLMGGNTARLNIVAKEESNALEAVLEDEDGDDEVNIDDI